MQPHTPMRLGNVGLGCVLYERPAPRSAAGNRRCGGVAGADEVRMIFYVGLHQPSDAHHFTRCCIHVERLASRRKTLGCEDLLLDSQAFMKLRLYGRYPASPAAYAAKVARIAQLVGHLTAVTEEYMCEPFMLEKTGLDVATHQRLTIERYDAIRAALPVSIPLLPVLQGYQPAEYVDHIRQYGARLAGGAWVGVGSVCKRNSDPNAIAAVLLTIAGERPDLRLHGFGVKTTALQSDLIRSLLYSADSMAWSYNARRNGRDANDWREAQAFADAIASQQPRQHAYQWSIPL
jgi:hypothetical protein